MGTLRTFNNEKILKSVNSPTLNYLTPTNFFFHFNHISDNDVSSEISTYRLPNNTRPLIYYLRINTWIHNAVFSFNGEVRITISIAETSRNVTLHSRQLLILEANLLYPDGSIFDTNLRYTYDSGTEFLTLLTNRDMISGTLLVVNIWYSGFLGDFDNRGFFRSSYIDSVTNETHWLASTQFQVCIGTLNSVSTKKNHNFSFQPINARQAFPCYDEIRYRTPFDIQIFHHQSYNAISNMDVDRIVADDDDYQVTIFETSPPMPTFQVSFTISNFDFVGYDTFINMRVYARPEAIEMGQGDHGLALGYIFLNAVVDYFGFPYVLSKSFQVALPEFSSDGMAVSLITSHDYH